MEHRGFVHQVAELENGDFEVCFLPRSDKILASDDVQEEDWPEPARSFDLSDFYPPQPMVRALSELETMVPVGVPFAVLAREPLFLFPELTRRGHKWAGNLGKSGAAFRIMIRRGGAANAGE